MNTCVRITVTQFCINGPDLNQSTKGYTSHTLCSPWWCWVCERWWRLCSPRTACGWWTGWDHQSPSRWQLWLRPGWGFWSSLTRLGPNTRAASVPHCTHPHYGGRKLINVNCNNQSLKPINWNLLTGGVTCCWCTLNSLLLPSTPSRVELAGCWQIYVGEIVSKRSKDRHHCIFQKGQGSSATSLRTELVPIKKKKSRLCRSHLKLYTSLHIDKSYIITDSKSEWNPNIYSRIQKFGHP